MYDVLIIGAGIIGSFIAHDLSKYNLKIAIVEKDSDVANEATMANSAIIHSGHDPKEGTLKAKLNVAGNRMYEEICKELQVSFIRTSAFVAATSKEEEEKLEKLFMQANNRNIPCFYLSKEEALKKEKNLSDNVTKVIELPTTGIVYPWEVAIALMEEAVLNDTKLFLNSKVTDIIKEKEGFKVIINQKEQLNTKIVINAAGIYCDYIYSMVAKNKLFSIKPRKGEYFVLDKLVEPLVSRVIYPVPSNRGKGVLVVPTTHGNTLLGPNSDFIEDKEDNSNTQEALEFVKNEVNKTVKNIPMGKIIRNFAGLRPTGDSGDFIIEESKEVENFINVAAIESPGLASAPAISQYVIENILYNKIELTEKKSFISRKPIIDLKKLSDKEKNELVKVNPAYGNIICRCEQVSEGEIIDAINRPIGAKTIKAVKKRVRPGMGRCQGGFCEPLVGEIIGRELGISALDVKLDSASSYILVEETKA